MQHLFTRTTLAVCVSAALIASGASYYQASHLSSYQISPEKQAFLAKKQASKSAHPKRFDKPQEAVNFYIHQRAPLGEKIIPNEKYGQAMQHIANMAQYSITTDSVLPSRNQLARTQANLAGKTPVAPGVVKAWQNIGPGNVGGRTRALVIDPQTPDIMYSAGVAGGIWKSTDAGQNWQPLDDMMVNLAVTTLVLDPKDNNTLYAGTGEGFFNGDALRGDGLFKSTDAGATWQQLSSTASNIDFRYVNKIAASNITENRLFAATRAGLFRSDDAGSTWTQLMESTSATGCLDIQLKTEGDTDSFILSCGSFTGATVYHSADGGDTITPVIEDELLGRTTLAYAPSNQNIAYALASTNSSDTSAYRLGFYKLYRSDDGGLTWAVKNSNENENILNTLLLSNSVYGAFGECGWGAPQFYNQGWYDNIIKVDPINPDVVWAGGIDLWRSDDAGENWDAVSRWWDDISAPNYAHADQHTLVFHPNYDGDSNKTLFVGNDGGVQRTDNADGGTLGIAGICGAPVTDTVTWTGLNNNYSVTQFYHGAVSPDGKVYLAGAQDNGTNMGTDELGAQAWFEVSGGDGGWVAIDPNDPNIIYSEFTNLSLQRFDPSTGWVNATAGIEGAELFPFTTPFMLDTNDANVLWIGNDRLWRTTDKGDNWVQASTATPDGSIVSEWAVAPGDSNFVMAGTDSGIVLSSHTATTSDSNTAWSAVQPTQGYISDLAIDGNDQQIAYVTYSTFGVNHIWKTINGGLAWQAIDNMDEDNGLPDVPVNTIVIDPNNSRHLFVGTDLGIFVSIDAGQNWTVDGSGFANTAVAHLEINNKQLYAFTHGRSAYRVDLSQLIDIETTTINTNEDTSFAFNQQHFEHYIDTVPEVDTIVISEVSQGELQLDGNAIELPANVALIDIDKLTYLPELNFNGEAQLAWHAQANDSATSNNGEIKLAVAAVNDAPNFTNRLTTKSVLEGTKRIVNVSHALPTTPPSDEVNQTVTYSVSPVTSLSLDILFDENTGALKVLPLGNKTGTTTFTITANDGQAENNTFATTVDFTVVKKPSSGSMSWLMLLTLPLLAIRRKFIKKG